MVVDQYELAARRRHMRRAILVLLAVIALPVVLWTLYKFTLGRPGLAGLASHDFGIVRFQDEHDAAQHTFELVNRTGEPIRIVEVKPSCACLEPDPQLSAEVIQPGETLRVDTWMTFEKSERKDETVTLIMEGRGARVLRLRAHARRRNQLQPVGGGAVLLDVVNPTHLKLPIDVEVWEEDGAEPQLELSGPPSVTLSFDEWKMIREANPARGWPETWRAIVHVDPGDGQIPVGEILTVALNERQKLEIPLAPPPQLGPHVVGPELPVGETEGQVDQHDHEHGSGNEHDH